MAGPSSRLCCFWASTDIPSSPRHCSHLNMVIMWTETDELWSCVQTRSGEESERVGARWRAGGREKEKIILKGFGFLYFNPKSYSLTLGLSPSCALFLSPIISPILSGDFQWELVEKKDSSSSDVSAICHARKGKKKHPLSLKKKKKAMEKCSLS